MTILKMNSRTLSETFETNDEIICFCAFLKYCYDNSIWQNDYKQKTVKKCVIFVFLCLVVTYKKMYLMHIC